MKYRIDQLSGVGFGTSGVRGLVSDMTDQICYMYAIGFLQFYQKNCKDPAPRVAIAGDLRESTPRILKAVCRAIQDFGFEVVDCGKVPTPVVALYALIHRIPSIVVTGSHIPADRNGIKFYLPEGEILKKDEAMIKAEMVEVPDDYFQADGMFASEITTKIVVSDEETAKQMYIHRLLNAFPAGLLQGIRIGLYEHSAVGRDLLYDLYTQLGAKVTRLGRTDAFVSIDTEAIEPEILHQVKSWAVDVDHPHDRLNPRFDAILSTDGDGDRPLMFDELGQWIRGDVLGILTARFLTADHVITPVNSSSALERCKWFSKTTRTKIGSPYVVEALENAARSGNQRAVGFEANGGFLTTGKLMVDERAKSPLSPLPTRDAAIVHIAVLRMVKDSEVPLSSLVEYLPRRVTLSDRITDFPSAKSKQKLDELILGGQEAIEWTFRSFGEMTGYDTTDGLRMMFGEGDVVHLRPSGNAPEFRCYSESDTYPRAKLLLQSVMELLQTWRKR